MMYRGLDFRAERELRGVSLDQLSLETKYSIRQLTDFEAGRFDRLPGEIFLRGIVRMYIHRLGLDPDMVHLEVLHRSTGRPVRNPELESGRIGSDRLWDAHLGPLAGFFLITGLVMVLLWPQEGIDSRGFVQGTTGINTGKRMTWASSETILRGWVGSNVSLATEPPVIEPVLTVRTGYTGVRIRSETGSWIRIQDMATGADELRGVFPGETIFYAVEDETMMWFENPADVTIIDEGTGRVLSEAPPGVIRFIPDVDRYIMDPAHSNDDSDGHGGIHGERSS
ncbi:helix-turn-helix domain-containing protein [bacterium]|nr:helix-turn-helix domain-containing protein [candidate division CSSED10-310 bacterium]